MFFNFINVFIKRIISDIANGESTFQQTKEFIRGYFNSKEADEMINTIEQGVM